jgi:excisionase family DNA binding protein
VGACPVHRQVARQGRTRLFRVDELSRALYDVAEYAVCGSEWPMDDLDLTERLDRARERSRDDRQAVADPLLDANDAAAVLKISAYTVRQRARRREIPAIRLGKFWRFRRSSLDAWIADQERMQR